MRSTITDAGAALLAEVEAGTATMEFTEVQVGNGSYESTETITGVTALKSVKNTYDISSAATNSDGLLVKAVISNVEDGESIVDEDYNINELGLFAESGGESILYMIAVWDDGSGNTLPAYTGSNELEYVEKLQLTISNTASVTVDVSGAYALAEDLEDHEDATITDSAGAHGIRYYDDSLQYYDGSVWSDLPSGGSTISVTTEDDDLDGATVTLTCGSDTYTGTMASGECVFSGITYIGTVSVSAVNGSYSATDSIEVPYYGVYESEVNTATKYTISITTSESTLYGTTVTATYGSDTKTATLSASGTATIKLFGYTGDVVLSATDGSDTATATVTIVSGTTAYTASLAFYSVYGVYWDGTSTTAFSRTDDAADFTDPVPAVSSGDGSSPFDDLLPWSGMERVTDSEGGTLVKIPKFWYKWTFSGSTITLQIADGEGAEDEGFSVSPAHQDRGDGEGERDYVYVGAYHCAASTYKSTTGTTPVVSITRATARTNIAALGDTIWQMDYAMSETLWMLYLVEYADWNVQATIGGGCSATTSSSSAVYTQGTTDSMTYHTGTVSSSHSAYGACRYRYIENLWGNCFDWCDGIYFSSTNIYVILNPANFSDTSNGTLVGTRPTSSGYISAWGQSSVSGYEWFMYPSAVAGSDSTYCPDYCCYDASGVVLYVGGSYGQVTDRGLFFLDGSNAASSSSASIGSRLQKLP